MTQTIKFIEEYKVGLIHRPGQSYPELRIGRIAIRVGPNGQAVVKEVDPAGKTVRILADFANGTWYYNPTPDSRGATRPVE